MILKLSPMRSDKRIFYGFRMRIVQTDTDSMGSEELLAMECRMQLVFGSRFRLVLTFLSNSSS
jgi:hypothetical protein